MQAVTHNIAGIVFKTEFTRQLPLLGSEPFKRFAADAASIDVRNSIHRVDFDQTALSPPTQTWQEKLFKSGRISRDGVKSPFFKYPRVRERLKTLPADEAAREIWIAPQYIYLYNFMCNRLDIFYSQKHGGYITKQQRYMPEHSVAANFQQIFSSFLPNFSAILLHAAGVIRAGRAVLFFAPDEGGKTTVVNHSNGQPIMSDDQLILRRMNGDIFAHATPLGLMTSGPCQAGVGAVFLLEKAPDFELRPLAPAEFIQPIWSMHQHNTFFLPQSLKQTSFQILCDLSYRVPVYLMRFPKNFVDWAAIDAATEATLETRN